MKNFYLIISILLITSCTSLPKVEKDIENTKNNIPTNWKYDYQKKANVKTIEVPNKWWLLFQDNNLNYIMDIGLKNNKDIKIAINKLKTDLLNLDMNISNQMPNFNANITTNKSNTYIDGKKVNLPKQYSGLLGVSYQLDLFRKLSNTKDASRLMAKATAIEAYQIGLATAVQIITKYFNLVYLNEQEKLYAQYLKNAQTTYNTNSLKYKVGSISQMELLQAKNFLNQQKLLLLEIKANKDKAKLDLATFIGLNPSDDIPLNKTLRKINLPPLTRNYPLKVLENRPDVKIAELNLRASLKSAKAAVADFYPDISFSFNLSGNGLIFKKIFNDPTSALASTILLPILNWPKNYINLERAKIGYSNQLINFEYTIKNALKEVETSFINNKLIQQKYQIAKSSNNNYRKIEQAMAIRYKEGVEPFYRYVDIKNEAINNKNNELKALLDTYLSYLELIVTLGGESIEKSKDIDVLKKTYYNKNK